MTWVKGLIPAELLRGVDLSTLFKAAYRGPSVAYIDPMKEIGHELTGVQAGFFSKTSVQLKRGFNPNDVDAEIEQERAREKEKGIVSTSNPANKTGGAGSVLPAPADVDEDDEDGDGDEAVDTNGNRYQAIGGKWIPKELVPLVESVG
jgi:capsid protein